MMMYLTCFSHYFHFLTEGCTFVIKYLKIMEERQLTQQTAELIARDFGLEIGTEPISEQELFDLLANEVAYMIEYRLESLMSLLYRLDVAESKIAAALSPLANEPANIALAGHILDRQKQRIHTKQFYKQSPIDGLDEKLKY